MHWIRRILIGLIFAERLLKALAVERFFKRAHAPAVATGELVSILQPILSGDPALAACLEGNLQAQSHYRREFLWLIDSDDAEARRICDRLVARYPQQTIRLIICPPSAATQNPKLVKLMRAATLAQGTIICVLDDDTMLPDFGLEECLPYLDRPGVGLAFGLPYYTSFDTFWSSLVACFVNSSSLMTYLPFAMMHEPITINGMCYMLRREVFDAIGGLNGLEHVVADDFAVAQRLRAHGYRLAQTPLRHAIRTSVRGPIAYAQLMQRWLIFPRESLMRHTAPAEQALFYAIIAVPLFFPWLIMLAPRRVQIAYAALSYAIGMYHDRRYLRSSTPWRVSWMAPLSRFMLPAQTIAALLAPRRIIWRGRVIRIDRGGSLLRIEERKP